jgi:ribonuclease VapC
LTKEGWRRTLSKGKAVADASAILALLNAEKGWEIVESHMPGLVISSVNYSEIVAKLSDSGMPAEIIAKTLNGLTLEIVGFDESQAFNAGLLRPLTRELGLSFGDRACVALGCSLKLKILTTDRAWKALAAAQILVIR